MNRLEEYSAAHRLTDLGRDCLAGLGGAQIVDGEREKFRAVVAVRAQGGVVDVEEAAVRRADEHDGVVRLLREELVARPVPLGALGLGDDKS